MPRYYEVIGDGDPSEFRMSQSTRKQLETLLGPVWSNDLCATLESEIDRVRVRVPEDIPRAAARDLKRLKQSCDDLYDLFYDIANDPDLLSHTPFDAVYFPVENQEHVAITPENVVWILTEIGVSPVSVSSGAEWVSGPPRIGSPRPNPFRNPMSVDVDLPRTGSVRVSVFDVGGRRVAGILDRRLAAGTHQVHWDGTDASGTRVGAGVYFLRLTTDRATASARVVVD